ncbi:ABC transporter substrate-binding protein [Martelella soudanensis]|uniref:ABC transporter substrate-binding protein n=1 Tax=unclassified Martelella TaxID=2629616 RepID=UPI0015DEB149|nr:MULTISPECIES: ABC transporter substrate-binding protein [unclassified Martelella]
MRRLKATLAATATLLSLALPAWADEPVTLTFYHPQLPWIGSVIESFNATHTGVVIEDQAPAENYSAGDQNVIRGLMTNSAPDVYLASYSGVPSLASILEDRGLDVSLSGFMEEEGEAWVEQNYADAILSLARVGDEQYAMPFTASLPIVYVNKEMIEAAGGSVDDFPTTWDGVIELAQKVNQLGDGSIGLSFSVGGLSDDWFWQMLVMASGNSMLNAEATGIGFDNAAGMEALRITQDMAVKTDMTVYATPTPATQQFLAGKVGMVVESPSEIVGYGKAIGDRFTMRTVKFPLIDAENGGLPAGGAALMMLAQDEKKQAAAWEFMKYMTSGETQANVSRASGYMPTNKQTAEVLKDFYAENPNFLTAFSEMDAARPWFAYPDNTADDVWKGVAPVLDQLQRGKISPQEAMTMVRDHVTSVMANK